MVERRKETYSSARHSIKMVEEAFLLDPAPIVEEELVDLSNSARTATMTAEMSYISRGQSLIVLRRV
jgi:hypothetical protein